MANACGGVDNDNHLIASRGVCNVEGRSVHVGDPNAFITVCKYMPKVLDIASDLAIQRHTMLMIESCVCA